MKRITTYILGYGPAGRLGRLQQLPRSRGHRQKHHIVLFRGTYGTAECILRHVQRHLLVLRRLRGQLPRPGERPGGYNPQCRRSPNGHLQLPGTARRQCRLSAAGLARSLQRGHQRQQHHPLRPQPEGRLSGRYGRDRPDHRTCLLHPCADVPEPLQCLLPDLHLHGGRFASGHSPAPAPDEFQRHNLPQYPAAGIRPDYRGYHYGIDHTRQNGRLRRLLRFRQRHAGHCWPVSTSTWATTAWPNNMPRKSSRRCR